MHLWGVIAMSKKGYLRKGEIQKRSRVLAKLFSSFFMSIGVIILVVTVIPKSPSIKIESVQVFSTEIGYRLSIIDEDLSILDNSLVIILENQLFYEEQPLTSGVLQGVFLNLEADSVYQLKVMGNTGFGMALFTSQKVTTSSSTGGMIVANDRVSEENSQTLNYHVSTVISDPNDEIQDSYLKVSYTYQSDQETYAEELLTIPIDEGFQTVEVNNIWNENMMLSYSLYGVFEQGDMLLDELTFHTPLQLYDSLYINQITPSTVYFSFYPYEIESIDIAYKVSLFDGSRLIDSMSDFIINDEESHHSSEGSYFFSNLVNHHDYNLIVEASYINPETLVFETIVLSSVEFKTPYLSKYDISVEEFDGYYLVTITGFDKEKVYDYGGYYVYSDDLGYLALITHEGTLLNNDDGTIETQFVIEKVDYNHYYFIATVYSSDNYQYHLELIKYEGD